LLVVGSQNSSNSKRLVEVGENGGIPGYLIDDERDIEPAWLEGVRNVAITAGASAPEVLVQRVIEHLRGFEFCNVREVEVIEENVVFPLPPELVADQQLTQISTIS